MSNELVVNGGSTAMTGLRSALTPQNFGEVMRFAELMSNSQFIPQGYRGKTGDIIAAITYGSEIGLSPMQALQSVAIINGKPAIYGDGLLAVCQSHPLWGGMQESIEGSGDARKATCIVRRKGDSDAKYAFSVKDARDAGLWGKAGPWKQYPDRMLQMRARGFALRDQFADALKGIITAEEARDYPANGPRDITPQRPTGPIADPAELPSEDAIYDAETGEIVDDRPTYVLGDDAFTAPDWLMEADVQRRTLSNGELQAWVATNQPTWRQIAADDPDMTPMVKALADGVKAQAKAHAEQPALID